MQVLGELWTIICTGGQDISFSRLSEDIGLSLCVFLFYCVYGLLWFGFVVVCFHCEVFCLFLSFFLLFFCSFVWGGGD